MLFLIHLYKLPTLHKMKNTHLLLIVFALFSCNMEKENVDLIVRNSKIYTVNEANDIVNCFAVNNGKFVAVGNETDIFKKYDSDNIVDFEGKSIYPGFNDAHCHFYGYGYGLESRVNLVGSKSFDEVLRKVKKYADANPGEWIEGRGWDQNLWEDKSFPTKDNLDLLYPDKPVMLTRIDGHAAIVNSEALLRAVITAKTKVEGGDVILKNGKPTGVLIDNAMDLVYKVIPEVDHEKSKKSLLSAQKNCFEVGLTSVTDAGLSNKIIDKIKELQKDESLKMRINAMLNPDEKSINAYMKKGIYKTDRLQVRSVKLFADGALGSRGAKLLKPYSDNSDNTGLIIESDDYYNKICSLAYENNYQVCTHAIGDSAVRYMLSLYESYLKDKNDLRWRIEHSQVVDKDDFNIYGEYSIIPSIQPTHATSDMKWAVDRLGDERVKYAYANKMLLDQNRWLPCGTDFPIEDIDPLKTFYAAVFREDIEGYPEDGFQIENALTREETLKSMTIWAAKACFEENEKGSIEIGKFADFVVLDNDIMTIEEDKILNTKVLSTYVDGKIVFKKK